MIPSPSDLTYFITVADLQNLSRAAERLGISQPSLTLAMQRLEEAVGTALLIRHKRGVSLTKSGKHLQSQARQLMQAWDDIKDKTLAAMNEIQGTFTIGCHPSVARYSLPHVLPGLLNTHPQLNIQLRHDLSRVITEQVIDLSVDIGIVINPVRHQDLVIIKLGDDQITLFASEGNQPAQQFGTDTAVLICDPELLQTQVILKQLKKQGVEFNRMIPSSNLEVIADLTKAGCGIGILPNSIASLHGLQALPDAPYYDDERCLLYHGQHRDVKAIQTISAAIKQHFIN